MSDTTIYRGFVIEPNTSVYPGKVQYTHKDYCCPECDPRYYTAKDEQSARAEIDELCEFHNLDSEGSFRY